jgi:MFS family permease
VHAAIGACLVPSFPCGLCASKWYGLYPASPHSVFISSLIKIKIPFFLFASALNGIGAAALWTSQGSLLTRYSGVATRGRNSGIFWGILQLSLLIGSLIAYGVVPGGHDITEHTATKLYIALLCCACTGTVILLFLGKPPSQAP